LWLNAGWFESNSPWCAEAYQGNGPFYMTSFLVSLRYWDESDVAATYRRGILKEIISGKRNLRDDFSLLG